MNRMGSLTAAFSYILGCLHMQIFNRILAASERFPLVLIYLFLLLFSMRILPFFYSALLCNSDCHVYSQHQETFQAGQEISFVALLPSWREISLLWLSIFCLDFVHLLWVTSSPLGQMWTESHCIAAQHGQRQIRRDKVSTKEPIRHRVDINSQDRQDKRAV